MKKFLILIACLFSSMAFASDDIDCSKDQETTFAMKYCSGKEYEALSKALKQKQNELRAIVGKERAPYFDKFVIASNKYAKAYCSFDGSMFLGGTMQGLEEVGCLIGETKRQIDLINQTIKEEEEK